MENTIDTTEKKLPTQDRKWVDHQLDRFDRASQGHHRWAEDTGSHNQLPGAKTCVRFLEGDQWTEDELKDLDDTDRVWITINKIARLYRLVVGYQRQNRFEPQVEPTDDPLTDYTMAEIRSQLMKQDLDRSRYAHVEAQVFGDTMATGRGFMDVRLDYSKNVHGDVIVTSRDPFRIYIDPDAADYDPAKWKFVIESSWMSREDILMAFGFDAYLKSSSMPDAGTGHVGTEDFGDDPVPMSTFALDSWFNGSRDGATFSTLRTNFICAEHFDKNQNLIRVLSGQHRELKRIKYLCERAAGTLCEIPDEYTPEEIQEIMLWAAEQGTELEIVSRMERRVFWICTAGDVLLHADWSPYEDFTIVPCFGYFRRGVTRGLIHDLIDPQREINKRRASIIQIIMTTANSGWQVERGSLTPEEETKLITEGSSTGYVQIYEKGTTKPNRIEPVIPAAQLERLEQSANADLKEVSGINESSLGEQDNAQSGVAVENRQRQTVVGLEMYLDNLNLTRLILGEVIMRIQQRYYKTPRIVRRLGLDGMPNDEIINKVGALGELQNDISIGNYKLTVTNVSAQDTFNKRQFAELIEMVKVGALPPLLAAGPMIDLSTIPYKAQLKQMLQQAQMGAMAGGAPPAGGGAPAPEAIGAA